MSLYLGCPEMKENQAWVEEWVNRISRQLSAGKDAFVFCHSPDNLLAPFLCREIHQRIANQIQIPPLPWDEVEPDIFEQGKLF